METSVFYSWQSDLPNPINRSFIEKALQKSVKAVAKKDDITVVPVIDRDTVGVGGSPDISATIFDKIERASIFVADVSIINKDEVGRKVPNPNVLIELGFALGKLGYGKVILVMNTAYGGIDLLPFDLRTKRVLTYDSSKDKKIENENLAKKFELQLETIFKQVDSVEDIQPSVVDSVKAQKPERISVLRSYMKSLYLDIEALYPGDGMLDTQTPDAEYDEKIVDALTKTTGLVAVFRSVIDEVATFNDVDALKEIFQGFKPILECYGRKKDDSDGRQHRAKYDYYRFIGNELFVILVSVLLREGKWDLLEYVLNESIIVDNADGYKPAAVDYTYFSEYTECFEFRKQRLNSNRISLRYDLIIERRKSEVDHVPSAVEEYTSADLLLFLKGESKKINSTEVSFEWAPWSLLVFEMPRFILLSIKKTYAQSIARVLGVQSVQDYIVLLQNKTPKITKFNGSIFGDSPIDEESIKQIGIR